MQTTPLVFVLVLLVSLSATVYGKKSGDSLQVQVKHMPAECLYKVKPFDRVKVHYTGRLETGTVFDSSVQAGRDPLEFVLGAGHVIAGWERGIDGMCVGEKRVLIIPPELAYGAKGAPPVIPPNAKLTFETELVGYEEDKSRETSFDRTQIISTMQFWAVPVLVLFVLYKVYMRYREDTTPAKKTEKISKKNKKK